MNKVTKFQDRTRNVDKVRGQTWMIWKDLDLSLDLDQKKGTDFFIFLKFFLNSLIYEVCKLDYFHAKNVSSSKFVILFPQNSSTLPTLEKTHQ